MIGMASGESLRFSQFVTSIYGLTRPPNTVFMQSIGFSVATNWNIIARTFLRHPDKLDWLLLVEDDHLLPQDTIIRMLAHDVDIVSALYVQRVAPFGACVFDRVEEGTGRVFNRILRKGDRGLVPVMAVGGGCLLIKRRVLEVIGDPWWDYGHTAFPDACNHDINFSRRVREAGFQIWCDLELAIEHMVIMPVKPFRKADGTWRTKLSTGATGIEVGAASDTEPGETDPAEDLL
jgi:GT2 family glycosyltransferase